MRSRNDYEPEVWESDRWNLKKFNYYEKNKEKLEPVKKMRFLPSGDIIPLNSGIWTEKDYRCYSV